MKFKSLLFLLSAVLLTFSCCNKTEEQEPVVEDPIETPLTFVRGADLSFLPFLESRQTKFFDKNGTETALLDLLKARGMNTVRIRIWHNPTTSGSSYAEVKAFSEQVRAKGLKVWLCVHYSDTWADPGNQTIPAAWNGLPFNILKDSVFQYTKKLAINIKPDIIQIGNEINDGFLWPQGRKSSQYNQFKELLNQGILAVREFSSKSKIMIHYAGPASADYFYTSIQGVDYDIIGLSYYPWWHGENTSSIQTNLSALKTKFAKDIVIAETAYPFSLGWNDWTNNILGSDDQLILPDYPATETGQHDFLMKVREMCIQTGGFGYCYWAPDWVAWDGPESQQGSSWENLALFDFNGKELSGTSFFAE